jgi:hypothetical protein
MVETVFTNPIFVETILPFLLVFTLIFAVLQKTKILGDGKKQIDAIVALVIGLIFVAFGKATAIITYMIPILGIALVVILIFMILLGSLYQPGEFKMPGWLKVVMGVLIAILVIVTVLVLTGGLEFIVDFIYGDSSGLLFNGLLVLIIIGAIVAVLWGKNDSGSSS